MHEARATGHRIVAMTFTARPQGLPLTEELDAFDAAMAEFTRSLSGRAAVTGYINERDIALAHSSVWHPHRHLIVAIRHDTNLDRLRGRLTAKWISCIVSQGGTAIKAAQLIQEVDAEDDDAVAVYCTSAAVKPGGEDDDTGQTIRDIVVAAAGGNRHAIWRLNEYASAMRGRRAVSSAGVLKMAREPVEDELVNDDRVLDIESQALRELDRRGLLDGLISRVARAVDGSTKRIEAHDFMVNTAVLANDWFIDWTDYLDAYYSVIDPGPEFDCDSPEWDEPEREPELLNTRLTATMETIIRERPGISPAIARLAALSMPGMC